MNIAKISTLLLISIIFIGCASDTTKKENPNSSQITITVDAGENKRVKIYDTVSIIGKGNTTDGSQLSFTWKKENEVLATTPTFDYIPTTLGVDTLTLTAQHNSGNSISNSMRVTVVESKVDSSKIPSISQEKINEYLYAINSARIKEQDCHTKGIFQATTRLTWNEKLYKASYEHIQDLIKSKTFSHTGSGTDSDWTGVVLGKASTSTERIETYGYNWSSSGENLAGGTTMDSAVKAINSWLKSDVHCENLMNPKFKEIGMTMIKDEDSKYTHYWGQEFGTPK